MVAKRTPGQVYATLRQAGFDPAAATVMTAISGAESGYDPSELGDTNLEDATWGPSYGLFQVRTVKGQTGSGGDRDITRLAASDLNQAKAAYDISGGGTDFTPWSVFETGKYQPFLPAAQQIAATAGDNPAPAGSDLGGLGSTVLGGVRNTGLQIAAVIFGLALLGAGLVAVVRPQLRGAELGAAKTAAAVIR